MSFIRLNPKDVVSKLAAGLCPQLPNETTTTKYLRQDGSWAVPPDNNDTYPKAVKNITRSGTTFTATCYDNSTFTFTQQDNNTTYSAGTGLSLSSTTFSLKKWTLLASGSGNITFSLTNYEEVLVVVKTSANNYTGSAVVPKSFLTTSDQKLYTSGGYNGQTYGRGCEVAISTTHCNRNATMVDGAGAAATIYVYGR